jgi:serine/threonine-protein kinase
MSDATLASSPVGFDSTVASTARPGEPGVASSSAASPASPASAATLPRATVLPRVEMVGAEARLVVEGKRRYEPTRRLGEGGLGEVLGVRDNDIGREVALKRMRPGVKSASTVARFADEVRTIGALEHPNIIPIHDVGVDENGEYYFVMKYVGGETLEAIIEKLAAGDRETHAHYGFERRVQIFLGLLEAVAFAHARGIVHRDIKPANVMVGAYGEVVLMDWGIAKRLREPAGPKMPGQASPGEAPAHAQTGPHAAGKRGSLFETQVGDLVGTPAYMSPEQARGEAVDERSDIYSLSLLLHELLCLEHPLGKKQTMDDLLHGIEHDPVPMTGLVSSPHQPSVPMELSWYVGKGVAKDRAARYQTVPEMIARLERRAEGDFPVQCPVTFMKRGTRGVLGLIDRHPFAMVTAMVLTVLAGVGGGVLLLVRALAG